MFNFPRSLERGISGLGENLAQYGEALAANLAHGRVGQGVTQLSDELGRWSQNLTRTHSEPRVPPPPQGGGPRGASSFATENEARTRAQPPRSPQPEPRAHSATPQRASPSDSDKYRLLGNEEYAKGNYKRAIALYNIANEIERDPRCCSNTALCHIHLRDLDSAFRAVQEAFELEGDTPKLHRIKGTVLAERAKQSKDEQDAVRAVASFTRALAERPDAVNRLNLQRAKALLFYLREEKRQAAHLRLQSYLAQSCAGDAAAKAGFDKFLATPGQAHVLPAFLICPMSLDILREPFQIPSGITYEKAMLDSFWSSPACSDGFKDPITKEPILPGTVCAPNRAIAAHVEDFLEQNPWAAEVALDYCSDWSKIKFKI